MPARASSTLASIFFASLMAMAAPAAAQYGGDHGQTVRCDSNDGRQRICPADTRQGVRMVRQYSSSPCVEGRTWGTTRMGIWVTQGCRAEFAVGREWNDGGQWGGNSGGNNGNGGNSVRCDSNDNRYRQCTIDGRRVYLERQYSKSPCVEGQSWGYGRGYVWVNNGCRAQFTSSRGGQWGGGGWDGDRPGNGWGQAQTLYCGSDDSRPRRCNVTVRRDARMVNQKSKSACIEGQSWGWDRSGIWVTRGCRADFQVY